MADPKHPTNKEWELYDPLEHTPPTGSSLLVITEGGTLTVGPWRSSYLAWGYKPTIPQSVKDRQTEELNRKRRLGL